MSNDNSNGNGREYSVNLHDGGCTEVRATGYTGPTGENINPGMTGRPGAIEVLADGTVIDRGPQVFNTANLPQTGLKFYSPNGGKTLTADQVNDQCVVEIPGFGKTSVAAAKRIGLLQVDAQGNLTDTAQAAKEQMKEADDKQKEGPEAVNFANQETNNTLMALDASLGRDGTIAVTSSIIGHLASDKWSTPEEAFEKAGRSLAQRTGLEEAVSREAIQEAYDGYYQSAVNFLNSKGVDGSAAMEFAATCSPQVKQNLMRGILMGRGPAVLQDLARRMKSKLRN